MENKACHITLAKISSIWIKPIPFFFDALLIISGHASLLEGGADHGKARCLKFS